MSDTVKIIIEIPKTPKNDHERWVLAHGIPLDDVKAEIKTEISDYEGYADFHEGIRFGLRTALKIIDKHIGKESEVKPNENNNR